MSPLRLATRRGENSELKTPSPETRNPKPGACPHCDGTGWMRVTDWGPSRVARCVCRTQGTPAQEAKEPGGFRSIADVMQDSQAIKAVLSETDKRVAEVIEKCRGAQQAVTSGEIAGHLWPGTSMDASEHERLRRLVTASVRNLRDLGRVPIAASKSTPPGYFIPVTADELRDMHDRLFREGVKLIKLSQLYDRDANLVRELEGQLGLSSMQEEIPAGVSRS